MGTWVAVRQEAAVNPYHYGTFAQYWEDGANFPFAFLNKDTSDHYSVPDTNRVSVCFELDRIGGHYSSVLMHDWCVVQVTESLATNLRNRSDLPPF